MIAISSNDIRNAFIAVGTRPGDIIMLHSDVSRIGPVNNAPDRATLLDTYADSIISAAAPDGTLIVLTASESYARHNVPYEYASTPSEQGVLSEHVRRRTGALRSMHPLFSLTGIGRKAPWICADVAPTAFGYDSSFERLLRHDALICCMGVDLRAMTFVHHVEQTFGVPYGYTKEWSTPVLQHGVKDDRRYFAFVRYLDCGVEYDFGRFQEHLMAHGLARKVPLGYGHVHAVRARDAFEQGIAMLSNDVFFFLHRQPTREPWKGARSPDFKSK